jgi:hypothetical protein
VHCALACDGASRQRGVVMGHGLSAEVTNPGICPNAGLSAALSLRGGTFTAALQAHAAYGCGSRGEP